MNYFFLQLLPLGLSTEDHLPPSHTSSSILFCHTNLLLVLLHSSFFFPHLQYPLAGIYPLFLLYVLPFFYSPIPSLLLSQEITMSPANIIVHRDSFLTSSVNLFITISKKERGSEQIVDVISPPA